MKQFLDVWQPTVYDCEDSSLRYRRLFLFVAGTLFLLFLPFVGLAQKAPNAAKPLGTSLKGTVTAQNGQAVAGATVKLAKNPPIGFPATAESDENGHYEFHNLQAGNYSISVESAGFKKAEKAIVLRDEEESVLDFRLDIASVVETVQVTGMAPVMSTESSTAPVSVVTNAQLVTLPTQQEQVKEVIPVTPGVVRTLDSKLVFKGSDENQSLLIINSTRNTDPVTGSFGITVPTDAVESFAVYKTPYDASLGSFSCRQLGLQYHQARTHSFREKWPHCGTRWCKSFRHRRGALDPSQTTLLGSLPI